MPSFKEWVQEKTERAKNSEQKQRLDEWIHAYCQIVNQINDWLTEDGSYVTTEVVDRAEQGLGAYKLRKSRIAVGDSSVEVAPVGRNVIGRIRVSGDTELRAAGRIDITDGSRKYALYRIIQDGTDVWYVVDERGAVSPWSRERLQEILMDLMS